jgi:hypothetical protein
MSSYFKPKKIIFKRKPNRMASISSKCNGSIPYGNSNKLKYTIKNYRNITKIHAYNQFIYVQYDLKIKIRLIMK